MIGLTIMDISREQMIAIVQFYLNNNLLNVTFQKHHQSVVEDVHQRSKGRFMVEFVAENATKKEAVKNAVAGDANVPNER